MACAAAIVLLGLVLEDHDLGACLPCASTLPVTLAPSTTGVSDLDLIIGSEHEHVELDGTSPCCGVELLDEK